MSGPHRKTLQVTARNAAFQQWQALLTNRTARHRRQRFLVQGVRPITIAVRTGWCIDALLVRRGRRSDWAVELMRECPAADRYELAPELISELGQKDEEPPELLAVVAMPSDDLSRLPVLPQALLVAVDRPASPGNLGTLIRSADAFGANGLITTGHGTDLYDPKTVRATTGSLFAVPAVRAPGAEQVLNWVHVVRAGGVPLRVMGMAEDASVELAELDLTGPTLFVVGNEARGMSAAWAAGCDACVRIPMTGAASSLNAAVSGSLALYEAVRQRRPHVPAAP